MVNEAETKWIFEPIAKKHQRQDFNCGDSDLDRYIKQYARQNHKKGIAKAYVATQISPNISHKVDGYYTISTSSIEFTSIPEPERQGLPKYPIPSALIGRLAVARSAQGLGLGAELLVDALLRIYRASQEIAIFAVRVDAIDERAKNFYLKYEFIPFQDCPLSLFLPIKTIAQEFLS